MLRDLTEEDLQAASRDEIAGMVTEYVKDTELAGGASLAVAIDEIDRIRRLPQVARAIVARYIGTEELFCSECGATSCIHGYPDL